MVLRLNKTRSDDPSSNGAIEVYSPLTFPLFDVQKVRNFSISQTQLGGTFSFDVIGTDQALQEGVFGAVYNNYAGVIEKAGVDISGNGILTSYSGRLSGITTRSYDNVSFSSATPFIRDGGQLVDQPFLPSYDNHYRLIDLRASTVLNTLANRAGYAIQGSPAIDYLVWRYEVIGGVTLESLNEVAKYGGSNAVLRTSGIHIIPWGGYVNQKNYAFEDILDGIKPEIERTEFTHVVVSPSSDITPWNSTYDGTPESLGSLDFTAGKVNVADLGGEGIQKSADWNYPKDGNNNFWVRFTGNVEEFKSSISQSFNETEMWDARQHTDGRVSFDTFDTFYAGAQPRQYDSISIPATPSGFVDLDLLYTWGTASKKFESQGDILPELLVVPYEQDNNITAFDVDSEDLFNSKLIGYGKFSGVSGYANGDAPDLSPNVAYKCNAYKDAACTQVGFAKDGSFYVGLNPHNNPVISVVGMATQPIVDTSESGLVLRNDDFTVTVLQDSQTSEYPIATVNQQASPILSADGKKIEVTERIVIVEYKKGNSSVSNEDRISSLQELSALFARTSYPGIALVDSDRAFAVNSSVVVDTGENQTPKLRVPVDNLPSDTSFTDARFSVRKLYRNSFGTTSSTITKDVLITTFGSTSGTPSQQVKAVEGKWTLFKMPRKTYVPTLVSRVGDTTVTAFYGNESLTFGNPKNVSGSLITDHKLANSHARNLCSLLSDYLSRPFYSFTFTVPFFGNNQPEVGDLITVTGVPYFGSVSSICIGSDLTGDESSGVRVRISCGRFDIV